jgi:N4-gp56 family major capsid protein
MTDFTPNMSGTVALDDSTVALYDQSFIVAVGQDNMLDQFAQYRQQIGASSIKLTKYARLGLATTPLSELVEVDSAAMSDTGITLTPAEYGNVVTSTRLADIVSGGKVSTAAARITGINAGATLDKLAEAALAAGSNSYIIGGTAAGSVVASQVASGVFLNYFYNKLSRANVPKLGGDSYVAIMHDDVIHDLRADTAAGQWIDVTKYALPGEALKNEVGMFKGFRIVRDNNCTFADQTGAGTVDLYNSYFIGANALGKAESQPLQLVVRPAFDKLDRFMNFGWKWTGQYKIVDTDAAWTGVCASSVGAN